MEPVAGAAELGATLRGDGSTRFRVWAPAVRTIGLVLLTEDRPPVAMRSVGGGYYEAVVADLQPGARYFYRLNDAVDRPDPASRFQPEGVHGPSAVTSREFAWTDAAWRGLPWDEFVIYEAHVGTFSAAGTFASMIEHLDELARLGVTALELMPVAQFPGGRNWGYDGVHPFAPQNTYGGPDGLKALVDACHQRSIAVVLDVVYNHLGPEGNYLHEFGPYFTDRYRTPWGPAIDFDGPDSGPVRAFFIASALEWISEFHVDALRLDATHAIFDCSPRHFLRELSVAVHRCGRQTGRRVYLIAENNTNDPRILVPAESDDDALDAQVLDDFQRSLQALLAGDRAGYYADFGRVADFGKACGAGFVLSGQHSLYRRRPWGSDAAHVPADRFVVYGQNHDTVGNRPGAKRLGRLVGFEELKLAAAATILSPSIPMLFMGEEYDDPAPFHFFVSHEDATLVAGVREGRRRELAVFDPSFVPLDPASPAAFEESRLTRSLAGAGRQAVLREYYRELLRLRKACPAIREPARRPGQVTVLEDERILLARRQTEACEICVCLNFGEQSTPIGPHLGNEAAWTVLLDSAQDRWQGPGGATAAHGRSPAPLVVSPKSCLLLAAGIRR